MSSYICDKCDTAIIEKDGRYVTECEHYPLDKEAVLTADKPPKEKPTDGGIFGPRGLCLNK